jgi:hypothetical protein
MILYSIQRNVVGHILDDGLRSVWRALKCLFECKTFRVLTSARKEGSNVTDVAVTMLLTTT